MRYEIRGPRYEKSNPKKPFFPSSLVPRPSYMLLYRLHSLLAGADANDLLHGVDEDLAVADLAGAGGGDDRLDAALHLLVRHHDLDLHLRQEIHDVFRAAIELGVPLLPAEALDLGHGQAGHAGLRQRLAHVVQLERFDDGLDLFHWCPLLQEYSRHRRMPVYFLLRPSNPEVIG